MNEEIANYIRTQILLRTDPGHDIEMMNCLT